MAGGYLGKISAIVSANTGDFKPKLDAAAKDVTSFAKSMQSTLTSASSASSAALRSIYTEAQKFDRALAAATSRKLAFKGFDAANLDAGITKAKQLYSVTAEITKPLAAAAKEFGKLSADVQGSFLPALIESQMAAEHLAAAIDKTGSVGEARFDRIKKKVDGVIESMTRIRSAEGLAGTLATGRELAFQQPAMVSEVGRSRNLQARALALGPESLAGSRVADLVGQQKAAADEATRLYSALEKVRASRNGDSAAAEAALNNQLALYAQVNSQIEREISGLESAAAARKKASDPQRSQDNEIALLQRRNQAEKEAESARLASVDRASQNEIALLQRRHQTEREIETSRLAAVARAEQTETALLQRRYQAEKEAETARLAAVDRAEENEVALLQRRYQAEKEAETARLAAVDRAEENEIALLQRRHQAERDIESVRLAAAARAEENEIALLQRRHQAERDAERQRLSEQPVPLGGDYLAGNLERRARGRMGGDVAEAGSQFDIGRQVDGIVGRVAAARSQLESLPEPIRSGLIPSLQRATESAATLARAGFGATAAQIRNATAEAARFEQRVARSQRATNFSAQFGAPGRRGVEMELQGVQLGGYAAQLQILQRELAGVSTTARAAATGPFDALRAAIERAAGNGTLGLRRTREEIQQLLRDAARATAGATGGSERGLMGRLRRAGDVGRGGFDRFTLGAQQAVFAIDDFFSVTGDFSQRMRAIGNNLTQIGFVMGGLTGLTISLAASLTAQGVAAYLKFANSGREAEDSAKALNATLERQKSIVESLAESFRAIASDIASRGFRGASKDAAELSQRMDEIRKKQRERNEARDAALSPEVQTIRATIGARQKELEKTSDINRSAALRTDIEDLRRQERQAVRGLRNRPTPSVDQAIAEVRDSRGRIAEGAVADATRRAAGSEGQGDPLAGERERNRQAARNARAANLDNLLLGQAPNNIERSVEARRIVERQLEAARRTATQERNFFGTSSEGAAAEAEIARLQDLLNRMNAAVAGALDSLEVELSKQALLAASKIGNSLAALEEAIGSEASLTLQYTSELTTFVDQLKEAQGRLADAVESGDAGAAQAAREEIEALRDATREQVSATNSVAAFAAALDRVSTQLINTVLGEARSSAEEARRDANAAEAAAPGRGKEGADDAVFAQRRRGRLEQEARVAEDRERELRQRREQDVRRFENDARIGNIDPQVQQMIRERDEAQAEIDQARENNRRVSPDAIRRRDEAQAGLDRSFEDSPDGRRNRGDADQFDRENAARRQREEDIGRGRELMRTPAEKAALEVADGLRGLQAAFDEDPLGDPVKLRERQRKLAEDAMRQQAPAMFEMADQVQNAIMQGPSRAALQATDVSTTQGAAELNRLLRGDDASKNQNLVELQKQNVSLSQLVVKMTEVAQKMGVVLNL